MPLDDNAVDTNQTPINTNIFYGGTELSPPCETVVIHNSILFCPMAHDGMNLCFAPSVT